MNAIYKRKDGTRDTANQAILYAGRPVSQLVRQHPTEHRRYLRYCLTLIERNRWTKADTAVYEEVDDAR